MIEVDDPAARRNYTVAGISENNINMESASIITNNVVSYIEVFTDVVQRWLRCNVCLLYTSDAADE